MGKRVIRAVAFCAFFFLVGCGSNSTPQAPYVPGGGQPIPPNGEIGAPGGQILPQQPGMPQQPGIPGQQQQPGIPQQQGIPGQQQPGQGQQQQQQQNPDGQAIGPNNNLLPPTQSGNQAQTGQGGIPAPGNTNDLGMSDPRRGRTQLPTNPTVQQRQPRTNEATPSTQQQPMPQQQYGGTTPNSQSIQAELLKLRCPQQNTVLLNQQRASEYANWIVQKQVNFTSFQQTVGYLSAMKIKNRTGNQAFAFAGERAIYVAYQIYRRNLQFNLNTFHTSYAQYCEQGYTGYQPMQAALKQAQVDIEVTVLTENNR